MSARAEAAWSADAGAATALLRVGEVEERVVFRASGATLVPTGDSLLALILLPAMLAHRDVEVASAVSPRLGSAIARIEALIHGWEPDRFGLVGVQAAEASPLVKPPARTACLFTGGLDSFCEVIRRREEIDDLLYVYGFDVPYDDAERRRDAARVVRGAAASLGLPLIEVETNLRSFSDRFMTWEDYHGAGLAATALLLQHSHSRLLIASSHAGEDLSAWGSHPLLDPLWSTERLEIVQSGHRLSRIDKAAIVAGSPAAMANLRVCYLPPPGTINCGACEKCLRTSVNLLAVGAAGRCQTLPARVLPEQLAALELDDVSRGRWLDNLIALRRAGVAGDLADAIELALERSQRPADEQADGGWDDLERRLRFDLVRGEPCSSGPVGTMLRRMLLRAIRPYTFHERALDEQLVAELRRRLAGERESRRRLEDRVERLEREAGGARTDV